MPIPLAITAGLGAAKIGTGIYQGIKASKIKPKRPTYKVQDETKDIASTYGQLAQGGVPGAKMAKEDIGRATQNAVGQAGRHTSSSANILSMIGQSQGAENRAMRQAEVDRQKQQLGLIDRYMGAKDAIASEKQRAWQYNQAQKFEEEAAAKSQLQGAAMDNVMSGIQDVGGSMIKGYYNKQGTPSEEVNNNQNKSTLNDIEKTQTKKPLISKEKIQKIKDWGLKQAKKRDDNISLKKMYREMSKDLKRNSKNPKSNNINKSNNFDPNKFTPEKNIFELSLNDM